MADIIAFPGCKAPPGDVPPAIKREYVFFAHSLSDYGTMAEAKFLATLNDHYGASVLNPAYSGYFQRWQAEGMMFFDNFILPRTSILAYWTLHNGYVGADVGYQVNKALKVGVPVHRWPRPEIYGNGPELITAEKIVHLTFERTVEMVSKFQQDYISMQ